MTTSAAQVNNLARLLPGVMFRQRPDLSFAFVTSRIEEFTGRSATEWRHQSPPRFWEFVHEADVGELQKQLKHAAESGEVVTSNYRICHVVTKRVTCIREQRQAVRDRTGSLIGYDGVWLDVTRQMISERLHLNVSWSEALAQLAEVLLHNLNNRVSGIHALCETFRLQMESDHPFYEGVDLIQRNAIEAKQIAQRIVDLDHGKPGVRTFHNLNELVTDGLELVNNIVSPGIRIDAALTPGSLPVCVDAVEFREMFIKLTMNAISAMPQGGTLRFETSRHSAHPTLPYRYGKWPRVPSFCLAVTDTGGGIPDHRLRGIFDPFSAAEPLGQVSGIELYSVGQFVEKHNGAITVVSELNKGTTFHIWLPKTDFSESDGNHSRVH